jgi:predicted nucleic acid-binding protein
MSGNNLFLDSSVLVSGIISANGAARILLLLAETSHITITVSEQVIAETERVIAKKVPHALIELRQAIHISKVRIMRNPTDEQVKANLYLISHLADVPIVLAAMQVKTDYLVTLNRRHFLDDPTVALRSGLRIGTPGDALSWYRERIFQGTFTNRLNRYS